MDVQIAVDFIESRQWKSFRISLPELPLDKVLDKVEERWLSSSWVREQYREAELGKYFICIQFKAGSL